MDEANAMITPPRRVTVEPDGLGLRLWISEPLRMTVEEAQALQTELSREILAALLRKVFRDEPEAGHAE